MKVWMAGQFKAETAEGAVWDFQGVFDSKEGAVAACRDSNYFVMAVDVNQQLPHETITSEVEYPIKAG